MKMITKILAAAAIGVATYAAVKLYKKLNAPIEQTMTVTDKGWSKVETISEWTTEEGSGWEVPNGAYDVKSTLQYRDTTDTMLDNINVGVSTGKIFRDGEADDIVLTNVGTTTPKKQLAKYYTWKIEKWSFRENVRTTGTSNASTAYSNHSGVDYDPLKEVSEGDLKVSGRTITFCVTGVNDETGESVVLETSPTIYDLAKKGMKVRYTISKLSKKPKNISVVNPFGAAEEGGDDANEVNSEA